MELLTQEVAPVQVKFRSCRRTKLKLAWALKLGALSDPMPNSCHKTRSFTAYCRCDIVEPADFRLLERLLRRLPLHLC